MCVYLYICNICIITCNLQNNSMKCSIVIILYLRELKPRLIFFPVHRARGSQMQEYETPNILSYFLRTVFQPSILKLALLPTRDFSVSWQDENSATSLLNDTESEPPCWEFVIFVTVPQYCTEQGISVCLACPPWTSIITGEREARLQNVEVSEVGCVASCTARPRKQ